MIDAVNTEQTKIDALHTVCATEKSITGYHRRFTGSAVANTGELPLPFEAPFPSPFPLVFGEERRGGIEIALELFFFGISVNPLHQIDSLHRLFAANSTNFVEKVVGIGTRSQIDTIDVSIGDIFRADDIGRFGLLGLR